MDSVFASQTQVKYSDLLNDTDSLIDISKTETCKKFLSNNICIESESSAKLLLDHHEQIIDRQKVIFPCDVHTKTEADCKFYRRNQRLHFLGMCDQARTEVADPSLVPLNEEILQLPETSNSLSKNTEYERITSQKKQELINSVQDEALKNYNKIFDSVSFNEYFDRYQNIGKNPVEEGFNLQLLALERRNSKKGKCTCYRM